MFKHELNNNKECTRKLFEVPRTNRIVFEVFSDGKLTSIEVEDKDKLVSFEIPVKEGEEYKAYESAYKYAFKIPQERAGMSYPRAVELAEAFASKLVDLAENDDSVTDEVKEMIEEKDMTDEEKEYFGFESISPITREWTVRVKDFDLHPNAEWYIGKPFISEHEYEVTEVERLDDEYEDIEFSVSYEEGELRIDGSYSGEIDPDEIGDYVQEHVDNEIEKHTITKFVVKSNDPEFDIDEIFGNYEYEEEK